MALGLGSVIDRPRIEVQYDDSEVEKGLRNTESKTKRGFGTIGKAAALGAAAGFAALGFATKKFADEAIEAQKVGAQTNAVIKSTGGVANVSAKDVDRLSSALMKKSGIDDEVIKTGSNMLLTFTKIRNEVGKGNDIFNQANETLLDMTVALGSDPQKQAIQLGKALNDPVKGMSALRRVGVAFTKEQETMVKGWVAQGDTLRAQKFILQELQTEFGGSAEAAGKTLGGQLSLLKNEALNAGAAIVGGLIPHLTSFVSGITASIPKIKEFVGSALNGIRDVFGRIGEAVGGAEADVGSLWDRFKEGLAVVWGNLRTFIAWWVDTFGPVIAGIIQTVRAGIESIRETFAKNEEEIGRIIEGLKTLLEGVAWVLQNVVLPALKWVFENVLPVLIQAAITWLDRFARVVRGIDSAIQFIREKWETFWTWLKDTALTTALAVLEPFSHLPGSMGKWARDAKEEVEKELQKIDAKKTVDKIVADMNSKTPSIEEVGRKQGEAWKAKFLGSATPSLSALTGAARGNGDGVVSSLPKFAPRASNPGGLQPWILDELGIGQSMGLRLSSGYRPGSITSTGNPSLHGIGGAIDMVGTPAQMAAYARMVAGRPGIAEVIYTPVGAWYPGAGWVRPSGSVAADHYDHVHVGARSGDGLVGVGDGVISRRFSGNISGGGGIKYSLQNPFAIIPGSSGVTNKDWWDAAAKEGIPRPEFLPGGQIRSQIIDLTKGIGDFRPEPLPGAGPTYNPAGISETSGDVFDLDHDGRVSGDDARVFAAQFGMEALYPHEIEARIQKRLLQETAAILGARSRFMREFAPDVFRSTTEGLRFGTQASRQGPTVVFNFQRAPDDPYTWMRSAQRQVEAAMA